MSELHLLAPRAVGPALRATPDNGRGFLGLDPITQNDALVAHELTRLGAQVFQADEDLLGYLLNPTQPRQAHVACSGADPAPLRRFLAFLHAYQRCTSYVAMTPAGSPAVAALRGCGFTQVGTLPQHRFQAGTYHDVLVLFANREDVCHS